MFLEGGQDLYIRMFGSVLGKGLVINVFKIWF